MEIKIVIQVKDEKALIGVQSPNCDPVFETANGDLPTIIGRVTQVVTDSQAKWATTPKNPNIDLTKPAAPVKEAYPTKSGAKPASSNNLERPMF